MECNIKVMQEQPTFSTPYEKKLEPVSVEDRERIAKQIESFGRLPEVTTNVAQLPYFLRRYQEEGKNLNSLYQEAETRSVATVSRKKDQMHDGFMKSREHGEFAQFIELLPLLANKEGRLGKYISARVTKTAKPDDAGASFVDVVVELRNDYLKTDEAQKDRFLRTVRPTVSFALDLTSNPSAFEQKVSDFQKYELQGKGTKAHVLPMNKNFLEVLLSLELTHLKVSCCVMKMS